MLGYDIWFYISHRILHTPQFYFIHKKHHEKHEPHWLDTYYGHPLESAIQGLGILLPYACMKTNMVEFLAAIVATNIRGIARHESNLTWFVGDHHVLHHKYPRYNFGEVWLDFLYGSLYPYDDVR